MGRMRSLHAACALLLSATAVAGCSGGEPPRRNSEASSSVVTSASAPARPSFAPTTSTARATSAAAGTTSARGPASTAPARSTATGHPASAESLPLAFTTSNATQVITVSAPSTASTSGTLQAWYRVPGGWRRSGPAVHAWFGTDGLSRHPSETSSATPIGSYTLSQAFGHNADPGTALPYTHTTPNDWWISQSGPLYNTRQRCASSCAFTRGNPNEHLYFETPYYDYAVVIDYNTRNAPGGVRPGAGSAFFLHVTVGAPTQGCVSIAADQLVRLLRWLRPSAHPRILIGTA